MELPSETLAKIKKHRSDSSLRNRNQKWFNDFYFERGVPKSAYIENNRREFDFVVGHIYTFYYFNPKWKDELEYYNAVPVGVFIGWHKCGNPMFLGLQFIPPKQRALVLDMIVKFNQNRIEASNKVILKTGVSSRMLRTSYTDLKTYLKKSGFEYAIRSYIITRIKMKPLIITFLDWYRLLTFSGQFMKKKNIAYIYYDYKKNLDASYRIGRKEPKLKDT